MTTWEVTPNGNYIVSVLSHEGNAAPCLLTKLREELRPVDSQELA